MVVEDEIPVVEDEIPVVDDEIPVVEAISEVEEEDANYSLDIN